MDPGTKQFPKTDTSQGMTLEMLNKSDAGKIPATREWIQHD